MNRREAISAASILLGGTIIGVEAFLSGCTNKNTGEVSDFLTVDQVNILDEVGETILPATDDSPGAKDAKIGDFMKVIVRDCYSPEEQEIFMTGLDKLNDFSKKKYNKVFVKLDSQEKHDLLLDLEKEAKESPDDKHYYSMFKQLTVWGFMSSEAGATKAFRHVDVPGRYDACIPLEPGGKAWV